MRAPIDLDYVSKAIVGIASLVVGVITSFQEQVEWHLRIASLVVGLAVGIMLLAAMVRKWRGRQDQNGSNNKSTGYDLALIRSITA